MERIMVTDDDHNILSLIESILSDERYEVVLSSRGKKTLSEIGCHKPDLLITDLVMPEMDGIDLIQKLRAVEEYQTMPILVLTGLKTEDKLVEALDAGADDFLGKPFSAGEILARVRTHLRVGGRFKTLGLKMRELKEMKQMRDDLTHMLVHDMKNPLAAMHGNLDLLKIAGFSDAQKAERLTRNLKYSCTMLSDLITNILDLEAAEQRGFTLDKQTVDVAGLLEDVLQDQYSPPSSGAPRIVTEWPDRLPAIEADRALIRRVLSNLIANAVRHTPPATPVRIAVEIKDAAVKISVRDEGPGVPEEYHQKIFEKFGTLRARKEGILGSTGLGLAFCRLAVEAHGGTIGLTSAPGKGSTFFFFLPLIGLKK